MVKIPVFLEISAHSVEKDAKMLLRSPKKVEVFGFIF